MLCSVPCVHGQAAFNPALRLTLVFWCIHLTGRMVTIRGTIVRMGVTRPLAIRMDFVCGKCGAGIPARFPEGKFTPPTRCAGARLCHIWMGSSSCMLTFCPAEFDVPTLTGIRTLQHKV